MTKIHKTVLNINLESLERNFYYLKSKLKPNCKFLGVVKASAYGGDSFTIAQHLEHLGIDYFAIAYASEGILLREKGIKTPILLLHTLESDFDNLLKYNLEPTLYNQQIFHKFNLYCKEKRIKHTPCHIEINTGLNRLGFEPSGVDFINTSLAENGALFVKSVFSHLVASEDITAKDFTIKQIETYKKVTDNLDIRNSYLKHILNTSGILNYPQAHFDMVRSGIGLYGFGNSITYNKHLAPVFSLETVISQINTLNEGDSVGYNRAFVAKKQCSIATLPIGHADGITRQYGNGIGYVYVNGNKAPIVGNVCMDMIMVDVTKISCNIGDKVIIFNHKYTADILAKAVGTISYELITGITKRVARTVIK